MPLLSMFTLWEGVSRQSARPTGQRTSKAALFAKRAALGLLTALFDTDQGTTAPHIVDRSCEQETFDV